MQAGLLSEIIEIYNPVVKTNEFGSTKITFEKVLSTRANVKQNAQNRTIQENEVFYDMSKTFIIRSYVKLLETSRIKYQDKMYRVISIDFDSHNNCKTVIADLIND